MLLTMSLYRHKKCSREILGAFLGHCIERVSIHGFEHLFDFALVPGISELGI